MPDTSSVSHDLKEATRVDATRQSSAGISKRGVITAFPMRFWDCPKPVIGQAQMRLHRRRVHSGQHMRPDRRKRGRLFSRSGLPNPRRSLCREWIDRDRALCSPAVPSWAADGLMVVAKRKARQCPSPPN